MTTYNILNILVGKLEVGESLQVIREGEAPFLFEVVPTFSNQIYGQTHHGGASQTLLSASAKHSSAPAVCSREKKKTCQLKLTLAGKQMLL